MKKPHSLFCSVLIASFLGLIGTGLAQWSSDPSVNLAIYSGPGRQGPRGIVSDDSGGAILVWRELLDGHWDVYAQRVDSSGFLLWGPDGVPVVDGPGNQFCQDIVEDGTGGAIIIWSDSDTDPGDIYAQRVDALGVIQWPVGGVCLCTDTTGQGRPKITTDCAGGAIVTWFDRRGGSHTQDIYAQRVNALGEIQWGDGGTPVCAHTSMQVFPRIVSDGSGGAIVAWEDYRNGSAHVYAQRIDDLGNPLWAPEGIRVSTRPEGQLLPRIAADGLGGAVICWADGSGEVYAQRIDSSGVAGWTSDGISVNLGPMGRSCTPQVASTGDGGALVAWDRWMSDPTSLYDIYVQRLTAAGGFLWAVGGVPVCSEIGTQDKPCVVSDQLGGAILVWREMRSGEPDIYAQRLDSLGSTQWADSGIAVTIATGVQEGQHVLLVDSCSIIVAWSDQRNGFENEDVYGQKVNCDGTLGITAVTERIPFWRHHGLLFQSSPNPLRMPARISYSISTPTRVRLTVYGLTGRVVETLVDEDQSPGTRSVVWNGEHSAAGIYFCRLEAGPLRDTRKIVLVK